MRIGNVARGEIVDELHRRLARHQPTDGDHHERIVRQAQVLTRGGAHRRRSIDPQWNQLDRTLHAIKLGDVANGIARLTDDIVGGAKHPANGSSQWRMQVRRAALARIEQIAAVHGQNIRHVVPAGQGMAERTGRDDEVRVDHVEVIPAEAQAAEKSRRQIRRHGREVRHRQLAAKEHRDSQHAHAAVAIFGEQTLRRGK